MDEEIREKMIAAIVKATEAMGASNYEEGITKAKSFVDFLYQGVGAIQTVEQLRALLDSLPPISKEQEAIALSILVNVPQLIRMGIHSLGKTATQTLPAFNTGRPQALSPEDSRNARDYILRLYGDGKVPLDLAKNRAALKFGVSRGTINRMWAKRNSIPERTVTLEDAIKFFGSSE